MPIAALTHDVNISIDGISIKTFTNLEISQNINNHHQFKLVLGTVDLLESMGKGDWWNTPINEQLEKCRTCIGTKIKIDFSLPSMKDASGNCFEGFVTNISVARNFGKKMSIVLFGYSPTIMASKGLNCVSFEEMTLSDIFNKVLNQYSDIRTNISPAFTKVIDYTVQYRESDYNFLSRLAQRYGEWFFYDGETLHLGPPQKGTAIELKLGKTLDAFDWSLNLEHTQFEQDQYSYSKNELFKSSSKGKPVSGLGDFGDFTLKESDKFYKQAPKIPIDFLTPTKNLLQDVTTSKRQMLANNLVEFKGESLHPDIKVGAIINAGGAVASVKLSDLENYGEFIVTEVTHHIHINGTYYNIFRAIPANVKVAPINPNIIPVHCEAQVAVVMENVDDPNSLSRVRVNFYWQKPSDLSPWLRVVTPHAGRDKGMYFIPELEEEVLVGFENGDPERPFIHGSFHHKNQTPPYKDPKNYLKGIRTVSRNEIMFNDEPGKETIMIFNKENKNEIILTLDNSGKIRIKTHNLLEMVAKDINITASNNMNIDVGNNFTMSVGNDSESTIGNDSKSTIGNNSELSIGENQEITIGKDKTEEIGDNNELTVGKKIVCKADKSISITSMTDTNMESKTGSITVKAMKDIELDAKMNMKLSAKMNLDIGAMMNSSIAGKLGVKVESNLTCDVKGLMTTLEGQAMTNVKAGAMVKMQGGIIMIN